MKYILTSLISIAIAFALYKSFDKPDEKKVANKRTIFDDKDFSAKLSDQFISITKKTSTAQNIDRDDANTILAVIYKRNNMTWFIKAKATQTQIDKITPQFYQYFIDDLIFGNGAPKLTHIPKKYNALNKSTMRYASYMLEMVDISITRLNGEQNTYANVRRWMKQVGLNDNSKIKMDFRDNSKTIIVRLPKN